MYRFPAGTPHYTKASALVQYTYKPRPQSSSELSFQALWCGNRLMGYKKNKIWLCVCVCMYVLMLLASQQCIRFYGNRALWTFKSQWIMHRQKGSIQEIFTLLTLIANKLITMLPGIDDLSHCVCTEVYKVRSGILLSFWCGSFH
jgi:hypothetical protein